MPFLQLTLAIGSIDPEPFEDALLAAGAISITLEDAADDPVLEPLPGTTPLWPTVRMKVLFDGGADRDSILLALSQRLSAPAASFEVVADRAWEREWLKDFRPMRFGQRLWVCPAGMRPSASELALPSPLTLSRRSGEGKSAEAVFLDLDPGLAFGTGTHPTTALCLEWLDNTDIQGKTVIDYGCGSGVLAIAALKLGARSAVAVDIDPQAITATRDNAERNGVADHVVACTMNEFDARPANIVLANILAEPLEQLAPALARLVVDGGSIVLSGLLTTQTNRLARLYAAWFDMAPVAMRDEWARLTGTKQRPC